MVEEVLKLLDVSSGGAYLDLTVGTGGHAEAILEASAPDGKLLGIDWDGEQLEAAKGCLRGYSNRVRLVKGNFSEVDIILKRWGVSQVDGALVDLGVSSWQLSQGERGFSLRLDDRIDMRFDRTCGSRAAVVLETASQAGLERIFKDFGEERFSRRIARAIVARRKEEPIRRTGQLRALIERAVPRRRWRIHPATRVFQALRIYVNRELDNLELVLGKLPALLRPGARLAVISFHSLEDRIVKQTFGKQAREGFYQVLTRKPLRPSASEVSRNRRARSAKLRAVRRLPPEARL
jgi:16S rRNA (cytosine1402-N4)-methyltransferase